MELSAYFKSIVNQDICAVVICDTQHRIIYMNPSPVKRYEKRGGNALVGKSLMNCHNSDSNNKIEKVMEWFRADRNNNRIFIYHNPKENKDAYMIALRNDGGELIGYYEKHEYRTAETTSVYEGLTL